MCPNQYKNKGNNLGFSFLRWVDYFFMPEQITSKTKPRLFLNQEGKKFKDVSEEWEILINTPYGAYHKGMVIFILKKIVLILFFTQCFYFFVRFVKI